MCSSDLLRSLFRWLPDYGVAADEGEGGVPAPDGYGEVEGGDDADDAEGVPGLHHAVLCALGWDGEVAVGVGSGGYAELSEDGFGFLLDGHGCGHVWFVASVEGAGGRWQTDGYPRLGGFCVKSSNEMG